MGLLNYACVQVLASFYARFRDLLGLPIALTARTLKRTRLGDLVRSHTAFLYLGERLMGFDHHSAYGSTA